MNGDGAAVTSGEEPASTPADAGQGADEALGGAPFARLRPPLASLLADDGVASREQLDEALAEAEESGDRIGDVVVRRGWMNEAQLADVLARQWRLPFAALSTIKADPEASGLLSREEALRHGACPVGFMAGVPLVAVADPGEERFAAVRETLGTECSFLVTTPSALTQLVWELPEGTPAPMLTGAPQWGTELVPVEPDTVETRVEVEVEPPAPETELVLAPEPEAVAEPETEQATWPEPTEATREPGHAPLAENLTPAPPLTIVEDDSTPVLEELERLLDRLLAERTQSQQQLAAYQAELEALRRDEARIAESMRELEDKAARDDHVLEAMRGRLAGMSDSLSSP